MYLIQISIEMRIIIGIAAMVLLFTSFIIVFVTSQRKKLIYQKNMQAMLEQRQQFLADQNLELDRKVKERTIELNEQKEALLTSLTELKSTQQQLVQSEKMASLGEMTAGVAHEIQNPLNFINNFSEVSVELFEEMETELTKGVTTEALVLAGEIKDNLGKIYHHGLRADKIVKAMLEHSRAGSGKRELTNLNELAEESLKLSMHGQRNKIKTANVFTGFSGDRHIPPILMVPQDISRVLVNLCNNAIYAVLQKQDRLADPTYTPEVTLTTQLAGRKVIVSVKDNGTGIPENVRAKIFQPFFTTKPSGDGTGLGLSLTYDIITKSHGGTLDVVSEEGEGATFTITLPLT